MNPIPEKSAIAFMPYGNNFVYILEDDKQFSSTEYKVLQNMNDDIFVKSVRLTVNGKSALYYLAMGLKNLAALLPSLNAEEFLAVCRNILSEAVAIKQNGFLMCENVDMDFEHIFVDSSTLSCHLIYLPWSKHFYSDETDFDTQIRMKMLKAVDDNPSLNSERVMQFVNDLKDGNMSFEQVISSLNPVGTPARMKTVQNDVHETGQETGESVPAIRLVALNNIEPFELLIDKDDFVIGKKEDAVDGCISFNKAISRIHCRISFTEKGEITITDLESANGTYVNQTRLAANETAALHDGDTVRLANSYFKVVVG